jgi:protein TonB
VRRAEMPRPTRRLGVLMLLSALLHGGVFLLIAGSRPASPQPLPQIIATLRLAPPSNNVASPASAPATPLPQVRRLPAAAANPPVPRLPASARPANDASPATRPAAVSVSGVSSDTAPGPALAAPAVAAAEATPGSVPPAAASAPAAAALAAYRQQLSALFAQQRSYPRLAAMRGWEGEVRLRLRVARRGNLVAVDVERSSGFDVLDQHARALLASIGDLPPPPGDGGEIQVVVPINYKLDRTT